jgi:hypothetical protein
MIFNLIISELFLKLMKLFVLQFEMVMSLQSVRSSRTTRARNFIPQLNKENISFSCVFWGDKLLCVEK